MAISLGFGKACNSVVWRIAFTILVIASAVMIVLSLGYEPEGEGSAKGELIRLNSWTATAETAEGEAIVLGNGGEESVELTFPLDFRNDALSPGDLVTITTTVDNIPPHADICVSSTYSEVEVSVDGVVVGKYGGAGSYPSFMDQPAPYVSFFSLGETTGTSEISITFTVPAHTETLRLRTILIGDYDGLRRDLMIEMGWMLFLSVVVAVMGLALIAVSFVGARTSRYAPFSRWLGLFSVCAGVWIFSETDVTALLVRRPVLLHSMTYVAFYASIIPYLRAWRSVNGGPGSKRMLDFLCMGVTVFSATSVLLQLLGVWQFSQSLPVYYVVQTVVYGYVTIASAHRYLRHGGESQLATFLLLATVSFDVFLTLELANYYYLHLLPDMGFYMIGALVYMFMGVMVFANLLRTFRRMRAQEQQARNRLNILENRVTSERHRYEAVAESRMELRRQRHDLRHQLAAIRAYAEEGDVDGLVVFLDGLDARIPQGDRQQYSGDFAVDAVASFYVEHARAIGIEDIQIRLGVSETMSHTQENDLCAIVGNLLENGVAAASESLSEGGPAFLRMTGVMRGNLLTIVMENSYRDVQQEADGTFHTTKADGTGTGLGSIDVCAKRNGGGSRFEALPEEGVFRSQVYLRLNEEE